MKKISEKQKIMKWYFTFGFSQKLENCFTVIEAQNEEEARMKMVDFYGQNWAFQYDENQWITESGKIQQQKYNLKEIKFGTLNK